MDTALQASLFTVRLRIYPEPLRPLVVVYERGAGSMGARGRRTAD